MSLEAVRPDSNLGLARGHVAVCIPVFAAFELFAQCVVSVFENTPADVPVLIADDASPEPEIRRFLEQLDGSGRLARRVAYMRHEENLGFVRNANVAFEALRPADVVLLTSDCVVPPGWLEGLRRAAASDSRVGTVTPLTNNGGIVSIPERNEPRRSLPADWTLERAADAVRSSSLRLYPELPSGVGHCLYIRRAALDLVGGFDESFSPGYREDVDFSQRLVQRGMSNVLADDVVVVHHGGGSFPSSASALVAAHEEIIRARYPYYERWLHELSGDERGSLARAISSARRALRGLSVTIDGRCLTQFIAGTQVHTLEVIAALHALEAVSLRVVVPPDLGSYAAEVMAGMDGVELLQAADVGPGIEPSDVVHRPYQVTSTSDVQVLEQLGRRLVVTQQDLISFLNPGYFSSYEDWVDFRGLTRSVLGAADRVVFFSNHAAREARAASVVEEDRLDVVHLGTDHRLGALAPAPAAPPGADAIAGRPFLLCLGTDYLHKNRLFALRLLEALRRRHGFDGVLVFAGAHVPHGGSSAEEAAYLARRPELAEAVVDLAAVHEPGKAWLLENAAAMLYPSTFEGFGLVPFEAAEAGLPCLFAAQTSIAELLPDLEAPLVPWDVEASAERVAPLLSEGPQREELIAGVRAAGEGLTWQATAERLLDVYGKAVDAAARPSIYLGRELLRLRARPTDPYGLTQALPAELRRPFLAVANRRWLRAPIFGTFLAVYRVAYVLTHFRRPPKPLE